MALKVTMVGSNGRNVSRAKASAEKMIAKLRKTESFGEINRASYAFDLAFSSPNRAMAETWQASKTISDSPKIQKMMGKLIDILFPN